MFTLSYTLADSSIFIVGGFNSQDDAQAWADTHMPAGATANIVQTVVAPVVVS
jgi:hypothetical protein